jgi:hypothetical protein
MGYDKSLAIRRNLDDKASSVNSTQKAAENTAQVMLINRGAN